MKKVAGAAVLMLFVVPSSVLAVVTCEASLTADHFSDETKAMHKTLQKSILDYRKLESSGDRSEQTMKELATIKTRIDQQKEVYQNFTSKYFPRTPVTAFGAACNDRRWVEEAKGKLIDRPEELGKHWFVWLDKTSRQPKAGLKRPALDTVAE